MPVASEPTEPWNLNIHHDQLLVDLAHTGDRVLDVGCGDGFLSARLAEAGCHVVALDADDAVLDRASERWPASGVAWTRGDVRTHPFEPASFDLVVSNAALHHLPDTAAALRRLAEVTRPGGTLGVVGFARNGPLDWPRSLRGGRDRRRSARSPRVAAHRPDPLATSAHLRRHAPSLGRSAAGPHVSAPVARPLPAHVAQAGVTSSPA